MSKLPIVYSSILYCLRQARLNIAYHTAAVVRVRFNRGIVILGLNLCSGRWRYKYRRQPVAVWQSCLQDKNGQSCYATFVAVLTVICSNKFGICPSIANKISDSLPIYHLYSAQTCCGRSSQSLLETIVFGRHCECFTLYKVSSGWNLQKYIVSIFFEGRTFVAGLSRPSSVGFVTDLSGLF